ncbi:MAG: DUF192 domain-containing protein [Rhizobiaceae bacterium]|nr:MAG: DUF192 domain-containing protein [Rhizobiaceae bacterium]CAG1012542.1 hypothetical protein RHIZO_04277 [Rhizobiaceae bacterium]
MSRIYWYAAAVAVALLAVAGYALLRPTAPHDSGAGLGAVDPAPLIVLTDGGERSFSVEIADEPSERQQGLMFREHMDDDHGMLFVFSETQQVGFWMKDTPLALDLIFIGPDGRVRAIRRGEPLSLATISPDVPVRFVFEVKAGIAARLGIEDGDRVHHPAIDGVAGEGSPGQAGSGPVSDD